MVIIRVLFFTVFCFLFSCKAKNEDQSIKIYHLKPNLIIEKSEYKINKKYYSLDRQDFFTIKNFDITNENHKIKIDSFVINYIKNDVFLIKNDNAIWSLRFFKYGDGITENTKHEYDTDYYIHNLFAQNKEICNLYFDTRIGYISTNYLLSYNPKKINKEKRKLILKYFENNFTPNK